ncbi:MAG: hypothetical protein HOB98_05655 [Gammaproteobacteria bacterium]|nr:hypothetical protein [Gammaproteobacteria bacterium]MBT7531968.1 hypothetical protein [Gammaproteobacteria bacterium]MBT7799371.1 hypothetical protein [Gammaproteobacteria bacterium]
MLGYEIHDLVGNVGVLCILVTYLLLQIERIEPTSLIFSGLNALGAGMVLFSLMEEFNLSAFIIESAWLTISVFGIARQFFKADVV